MCQDAPAAASRAIEYATALDGIEARMLEGFFEGWPDPPSPQTHLRLLHGSAHVVLARDGGRVVGFITAISDGSHFAFISLLEVLPSHRRRGIGRELVCRMMLELRDYYAIDLACDRDLESFYALCGLRPSFGMMLRNMERQGGGRREPRASF